jgi:hypothetical protein
MAQVIQYLPSKCKALNSNPSTPKKLKQTKPPTYLKIKLYFTAKLFIVLLKINYWTMKASSRLIFIFVIIAKNLQEKSNIITIKQTRQQTQVASTNLNKIL